MFNNQGNNNGMFSITRILPHLILIAIAIAAYYYFIYSQGMFSEWSDYIYWGVKIFIALEIILASGRSFMAPVLGLIAGVVILFSQQLFGFNVLTLGDTWQLIIVSIAGFFITYYVKL